MEYNRTNWVDHKTELNAEKLNNIEDAIETISDEVNEINKSINSTGIYTNEVTIRMGGFNTSDKYTTFPWVTLITDSKVVSGGIAIAQHDAPAINSGIFNGAPIEVSNGFLAIYSAQQPEFDVHIRYKIIY